MLNAEAVFLAALEKPTAQERAAYVDGACAGQPDLLARVRELLAAHEQSQGPLDVPPSALVGTVDEQPIAERPGSTIGPYKLLQQIGEGGMGVVYMAEQQEPVRRKVALKIIKPGMDSAGVLARFEAERQALAMMDHPNIARILDAGATASGRPYFVMELVQGIPITKFCDDRQFTPRERLQLFVPICQAIQHAHQKGIIHRDIKPSNVLVTMYDDKPVPKVIDFGVAKAIEQRLTEKTLFTQFGALVGTFEYMSPEQAEMNAFGVDTRSDVYSLGVLLYELLTGTTPLEKQRLREAALDELIRLIREEEAPPPSVRLSTSETRAKTAAARKTEPGQLSKLVRGELDWITMKSLEKARSRRYESASALGRDVERYLHDEPVEACPPSALYRVRKFVRRHRGPVLVTTLLVGALLFGIIGTTVGMVRAVRMQQAALEARNAEAYQREKAETARLEAEALAREAIRARDQVMFQELRAGHARHAIQLDLAMRAWEKHDVRDAERILNEVEPRFQATWEQRYVRELCRRKALPLTGHTSIVWSVAYSPDGRRIVSGSDDKTVRVWDTATGAEIAVCKGHSNAVVCVVFSADGKQVISSSTDNTVRVWDATTGKEQMTLKGHTQRVYCVATSRDGKLIVSGSADNTVKVWDAQTGQEKRTLKEQVGPDDLAISPDNQTIVVATAAETLKTWNALTGEEKATLQENRFGGYPIDHLSFSGDGKRIFARHHDGPLQVWNAQTGKRESTLDGPRFCSCLAMSADGQRIVGGYWGGDAKVWDAKTGQELLRLTGHVEGVHCLSVSPDGQNIVAGGGSMTRHAPGEIRVWDVSTRPDCLTIVDPAEVKLDEGDISSVAASPDGRHLVLGIWYGSTVKVCSASTGKLLHVLKGHTNSVASVAVSPDSKRIASAGNEGKVWDIESGRELLSLAGHTKLVRGVAWSPDGKRILTGSDDKMVKVWDAEQGGELLTWVADPDVVNAVAFSPDGTRIVTGGGRWSDIVPGVIKVWDAATGRLLLTLEGHTHAVLSVAFSPDATRIVSGSLDRTVRVWNAATGQELHTLKGHTLLVTSAVFTPDGQRIVSGSRDQTLRLWDVATGQEKLTLRGHTKYVNGVAVSPDGRHILSAGQDKTARVWDAPPLPVK